MKKYRVMFEIYNEDGSKQYMDIFVEAGNRKMATLRAMGEISKNEKYRNLFKNVKEIAEVA